MSQPTPAAPPWYNTNEASAWDCGYTFGLETMKVGLREFIAECEADIPEDNGNATAHHIAKQLKKLIGDAD